MKPHEIDLLLGSCSFEAFQLSMKAFKKELIEAKMQANPGKSASECWRMMCLEGHAQALKDLCGDGVV
jgi:hypothetical protein